MPVIQPPTLDECRRFIRQHRGNIVAGVYDVMIKDEWVNALTPEELLLLARTCRSSGFAIAHHAKDREALAILGRHPIGRRTVAQNQNAPPELLAELAREEDVELRAEVAKNPSTSPEVLQILALDADPKVQSALSDNDKAPEHFLRRHAPRWCDFCGRLASKPTYFTSTCAVCKKRYCEKHGQTLHHNASGGYTYYWHRCIDHLRRPGQLGSQEWKGPSSWFVSDWDFKYEARSPWADK